MRIRWGSDIKFSAILFTSPNLDVAVNYAPARTHFQSCEPDGALIYRDSRTAIYLQPYVHVVRTQTRLEQLIRTMAWFLYVYCRQYSVSECRLYSKGTHDLLPSVALLQPTIPHSAIHVFIFSVPGCM
jgi:hypothetical protein